MRSKKKSNRGLLVTVLLILAAAQIAGGTFAMVKYRDYMMNDRGAVVEEDKQDEEVPSESEQQGPSASSDEQDEETPDADEPKDVDGDEQDKDDEEEADASEQDIDDDKDDEDEEEDEDEQEPEKKKNYVVMVVRASDNFAAVRTGRGTQYQEVGRITNGHRVALTDLENGWYKIARGKYKGYYTHQSSYVKE